MHEREILLELSGRRRAWQATAFDLERQQNLVPSGALATSKQLHLPELRMVDVEVPAPGLDAGHVPKRARGHWRRRKRSAMTGVPHLLLRRSGTAASLAADIARKQAAAGVGELIVPAIGMAQVVPDEVQATPHEIGSESRSRAGVVQLAAPASRVSPEFLCAADVGQQAACPNAPAMRDSAAARRAGVPHRGAAPLAAMGPA
mmetsp:Transcript_32334/g.89344  ORF Transcript_32334/g.89344 Transcript_32334/m.89344 type:complete len:203 (+) Transcript_32334:500-1108(+)